MILLHGERPRGPHLAIPMNCQRETLQLNAINANAIVNAINVQHAALYHAVEPFRLMLRGHAVHDPPAPRRSRPASATATAAQGCWPPPGCHGARRRARSTPPPRFARSRRCAKLTLRTEAGGAPAPIRALCGSPTGRALRPPRRRTCRAPIRALCGSPTGRALRPPRRRTCRAPIRALCGSPTGRALRPPRRRTCRAPIRALCGSPTGGSPSAPRPCCTSRMTDQRGRHPQEAHHRAATNLYVRNS